MGYNNYNYTHILYSSQVNEDLLTSKNVNNLV